MLNSATPWTAACQASLSFTISQSLLRFMSIESVMLSNHLILWSPSPPAFNLSQHQGLFQWVGSSHQVAKMLETSASSSVFPVNIQGWFPLRLTGLISLLSMGLSRVFSSTRIWRHQCFSAQPSLWSNSHPYMTTRKTIALTIWTFVGKVKHYLSTNITGNMKAYASSKL